MRPASVFLTLLMVGAVLTSPAAAIPDSNKIWDGWGNGTSEDGKDSLGLPDITSWDFTIVGNTLQSINIDYDRGYSSYNTSEAGWITTAWGLLEAGDLFLDIVTHAEVAAGTTPEWDYVFLRDDAAVADGRMGQSTTEGLYKFNSPLDATKSAIPGSPGDDDYAYLVTGEDPGPWGGGWNIRQDHAFGLKDTDLVGSSNLGGSFSWDRLGHISLGTTGQALFSGLNISMDPTTVAGISVGFTFNCANDVLFDTTTVPLETVPEPGTLLLLGTGLAGVLCRKRLGKSRT